MSSPQQSHSVSALANAFKPAKYGDDEAASAKPNRGRKSKHVLHVKTLAKVPPGTSQSDINSSRSTSPKPDRQPPSKQSGGIPSPSKEYLTQSLNPPSTLPHPRRILVILDLNGTLLFRPSRRRPSKFVERPHARAFLDYCLNTFHLAIWSSARPMNVNNMVAQLLTPEQREKCILIWARDKFGLSPADYDARVQVYKRLSIIWNAPDVKKSHPAVAEGGVWDQSNTVLVDDSREKGRSEPHNILPIPEFSGLEHELPHVLPQVHDYLNLLCHQADISCYMRKSPFALDPKYVLPQGP